MDPNFREPETKEGKACWAISARVNGVWDNPALQDVGEMSGALDNDILEILEFYGVG